MTLALYNSLTRKKEPFTPLDATNVRMYVCGPTVYARPHLGNARSVVVYDVLFRLLRHLYGEEHVTYVRNITDVDDKINAAAVERGITIRQLTDEVTAQFHEDMDALNCLRPTVEPTATGHISEIIAMTQRLIENGCAYVAEGHVLFDVTSSALTRNENSIPTSPGGRGEAWHYGMLSGRKAEEQESGARIAVESYKKNPGDFVLWKPAKESDDASSKFDSPWGVGRPGWHIECSAMSTKHLGATFDIHGGGADLMFPHHENEIAQSRCAAPESEFAKVWVHNGFLTVNGGKMSKSVGNFTTVKDVINSGVHGDEIRFSLMNTHYRKPLDWNVGLLGNKLLQRITMHAHSPHTTAKVQQPNEYKDQYKDDWKSFLDNDAMRMVNKFVEILGDDLNFSEALTYIDMMPLEFSLYALSDGYIDRIYRYKAVTRKMAEILGIGTQSYYEWLLAKNSFDESTKKNIESFITARTEAKAAKNWKEADRIRDELKAQGIILEDRPDGTTDWRRA